jgi:hypothetical protein
MQMKTSNSNSYLILKTTILLAAWLIGPSMLTLSVLEDFNSQKPQKVQQNSKGLSGGQKSDSE